MITIDLSTLFTETAKLSSLTEYCHKSVEFAGNGTEVVLTGKAPVWLYLAVSHALHGKVIKLVYNSPVTGDVTIFDHNPF